MPSKLRDCAQSFTEKRPVHYKQYPDLRSFQTKLSPSLGPVGPRGSGGGKEPPEAEAAQPAALILNCVASAVQCSTSDDARGEVVVVVRSLLWGLARSPLPPPPLNGAVQLCTLQWEGRRPKSGGPAPAAQSQEEGEEEIS